jgi:hypothetical protein
VWQSLADANADPDGHSHGDSYSDSNTNGYSYSYSCSYGDCNSYAYVDAYGPAESKPDTKATSDIAASAVSGSGKLIVHSAAGVERPRLHAFLRQASSHPETNSPDDTFPACLISQDARYGAGDNGSNLATPVKGGSASPWRAVAFDGGGRTQ